MCVGVSIGEGGADSERTLPPPLVKDDVIDLNHELRFAAFWKTDGRQSDVHEKVERVGAAYRSRGLPLGGPGCGAVGDNPQRFFLVRSLQDFSVSTTRESGTTEEAHRGEVLRALCDTQGLRAGKEESDHGDAESEGCGGGYYEIISERCTTDGEVRRVRSWRRPESTAGQACLDG